MKKYISLVVAVGLIICILSGVYGCGGSSTDGGQNNVAAGNEISNEKENSPAAEPAVELEPAVIVDNEYVTFTIEGLEKDPIWGYELKLFLENKTDRELMFAFDETSVNGYMCDSFWAESVTAGMKSKTEAHFSEDALEKIGISKPSYFEFELRVYDANDWMADNIIDEYYSYGVAKDISTISTDKMQLLFENDACAIYVVGYGHDSLWGYTMTLYLENRSDNNLMFSADGVAVNGFMCDPFWVKSVAAGKKAVTDVSWSDDKFEENGIDNVEVITFPIRVYDSDNWLADDVVNQTFTINP